MNLSNFEFDYTQTSRLRRKIKTKLAKFKEKIQNEIDDCRAKEFEDEADPKTLLDRKRHSSKGSFNSANDGDDKSVIIAAGEISILQKYEKGKDCDLEQYFAFTDKVLSTM
nr:unnamed protein product [Callosobruchus chinensis]